MNLYFDTSALIKLVVREDGSAEAGELWGTSHPAISSILCYPEGRAALAAARRGARLTAAGHARAVADFDALQAELYLVAVREELARTAGDLAADLALRGYDAVHLASALALEHPVTVVSWDRDLRAAAHACGCAIAPARG